MKKACLCLSTIILLSVNIVVQGNYCEPSNSRLKAGYPQFSGSCPGIKGKDEIWKFDIKDLDCVTHTIALEVLGSGECNTDFPTCSGQDATDGSTCWPLFYEAEMGYDAVSEEQYWTKRVVSRGEEFSVISLCYNCYITDDRD